MGFVFESMVEQAYYRMQKRLNLPLVTEWGRWEGMDRNKQSIEVDIASSLFDGRVLSGAIKWRRGKVDIDVHNTHITMLTRLADSGVAWAITALDKKSPLLYAAAGGFTERFKRVVGESRKEVYMWSLEDMFG